MQIEKIFVSFYRYEIEEFKSQICDWSCKFFIEINLHANYIILYACFIKKIYFYFL